MLVEHKEGMIMRTWRLLQHTRLMVLPCTVVSRAFQVLSDPDKKAKFDRFGGDPDNRFGPSPASGQSPFSGFARSPGRGPMFEDEISAEEMFNRFFGGGGGMGGGFGPFGMARPGINRLHGLER